MSQWNKAGGENPVRTAVRFPLQLAIRLETDEGAIDATTVNVSAAGLLFIADKLRKSAVRSFSPWQCHPQSWAQIRT